MAILTLTLPVDEIAVTGKQITFEAPCDSKDITDVVIDGQPYALVDTVGSPIHSNAFAKGAIVAVILNAETKKAYIQNSALKYADENFYNKTQIDAMLGSYVNDIANLLGGEALADS